jgi:hypothetical protein
MKSNTAFVEENEREREREREREGGGVYANNTFPYVVLDIGD